MRVRLPEEIKELPPPKPAVGGWTYDFPANCEVRTEPVKRWELGTLMGCVIPLIIRTFGGDPAIASGALVATLVDVSGIIIFFTVAKAILL
jgi:magnesium transporter